MLGVSYGQGRGVQYQNKPFPLAEISAVAAVAWLSLAAVCFVVGLLCIVLGIVIIAGLFALCIFTIVGCLFFPLVIIGMMLIPFGAFLIFPCAVVLLVIGVVVAIIACLTCCKPSRRTVDTTVTTSEMAPDGTIIVTTTHS